MKTIKIRNVEFGAGASKIAVPIVGETQEDIVKKGAELRDGPGDLVEWRADYYKDVTDPEALLDTAKKLREALGEMPILFTIRTKHEGGLVDIDDATYAALNKAAAESGCVDLLDVEIFRDEEETRKQIAELKKSVTVLGSYHDFSATPPQSEIVAILTKAKDLGADISKIAVMPQTDADVVALLAGSVEMREKNPDQLLLTISMGARGMLTRIGCGTSGSCITFGAVGQGSAPGQIQAQDLKRTLDLLQTVQGG